MQAINNVATKDAYDPALTLEDRDATLLAITIANASVFAELRAARGSSRDQSYGNEILLDPQRGPIPNVSGAKFRSAVPGQPARIIATLVGPTDPQISGGIAFSGTLLSSGQVVTQGLSMASAAPTGTDLIGVPDAGEDVPDAALAFTTVGPNAKVFWFASFEFDITATGVGQMLGFVLIDGGQLLPRAVLVDPGAPRRDQVAAFGVASVAPGPHVMKLFVQKVLAGGNGNLYESNGGTGLAIEVLDA